MCLKVWSRQRHDLPTPGVPSNAAAGDVNPKISNRVRGQTVKPMIQFPPLPPFPPGSDIISTNPNAKPSKVLAIL